MLEKAFSWAPVWVIVAIVIVIFIYIVLKSQDAAFIFVLLRKYMFYIFIIGAVLLVVFSANQVNKANDLDFNSLDGLLEAGRVYFSWFLEFSRGIVRTTGYVVKGEWVNSTGK